MNGDTDGSDQSKEDLKEELRKTRSKVRELENELAETNEGMLALTIELENAKERYRTIFEESSDAVLLIDTETDNIYEANSRACELLGYEYDSLVSLSVSDIVLGNGHRYDSFAEAIIQGWGEGFTCRTKDGKRIDAEVSASTVTLDGQSLLLASLRDVTERKRREQRLQVLNRIFRHNLRNEGNIIQGHADILDNELSDSHLEADAGKIRTTIDNLLRLSGKVRRIQDVLDQKQIKSCKLCDLLDEQQELCDQRYPAESLSVDPPDREAVVAQRLGTALREAVENAYEHNDSGTSVQIEATIMDEGGILTLSVRDNGTGIPEHEQQALQKGRETPHIHGSGIGLWVIQWIIDSLGGELTIADANPQGTILTLEHPLVENQDKSHYINTNPS